MNFDKEQIKAINSMNNTLVVAGAGSGKTTTIIGKISYIIENKLYKEDEILVLSFTNETVNTLKKRVNYNVAIKTFHKLALDIIYCKNKNATISSDKDLKYIINEYLNSYAIYNKKTNLILARILKITNRKELINLIFTFINIYKCNYDNINYLFNLYKKSYFINKYYLKIILDIYIIYLRELESSCKMDFNDLIINAANYIKKNEVTTKYKYIIIDEFQDISPIRFNLIKSILDQNNGYVFAVGDDYQSIYKFSGCNISFFINFNKLIPNVNIISLKYNYRNHQSLVDVANNFIIRNKNQIIKNIICLKDIDKPIKIIFYVNKKTVINNIIDSISGKILILGRNNRDKESFNILENEKVKFLTIHKSKGIEENNVILINLYNNELGFPSKIKKENIITKILKTDYIMYEEERRLFYVALTRTKNNIYILTPKDNYSVFIKELIKYNKKKLDIIYIK